MNAETNPGRRPGRPGTACVAHVVIGRNEASRLRTCLESVCREGGTVIYVDSGSTDGSCKLAEPFVTDVVELDDSTPFTAARARNAGVDRVRALEPDAEFVQFVDGDCELIEGWVPVARATLQSGPEVAAVCGRLRERARDSSVYNLLCDIEWAREPGEIGASGGIVMMRLSAFSEAGRFDPTLIAGEEPDLCLRMRERGWKILALDHDMAIHDAGMTHFSQWWRRRLRAGHTYAESLLRNRGKRDPESAKRLASAFVWGLGPIVAPLAFAAGLPLQYLRIKRRLADALPVREASLYAAYTLLGKLPESLGALRYGALRIFGRSSELIEHK